MKRKQLLSGILGILLVFGILLFTACPTDDNDTSGGNGIDNNGTGNGNGGNNDGTGNGNGGDNNGGNNGNNSDTRQEGVYIGIISFAGDATDLTGGLPVLLNASGKSSLTSKLNSGYTISSQGGTALFYSVHQTLANLKSRETQYPANLDSVNVITFTDGLDNGSTGKSKQYPIEEETFNSDNEYTTYLNQQITSRTIAGKPITAYSVGIRGNDVNDTTKFQGDLAKIASTGKSQELTDFGGLQTTFQGIANSLQVTHSSTTFTMKTTMLQSGTKVRMTFDVSGNRGDPMPSSSCEGSAKYIEGTISDTGTGAALTYTFSNITYAGGLGSSQGAGPITGTINGSEVNFTFTGVTGYTPPANSTSDDPNVKQWTKASNATSWQINSEYRAGGVTNTQVEKRSAIIYLVLDASTSLNTTQIGQIRSAVNEFINSLYNQLNGGSGGNTGGGTTTTPSAPSSVNATAQSSSSISLSWSSVSGADYYRIYRSENGSSYSSVGESSSTSFTDSSVLPNTTYYYKVSAVNSAGESPQSNYAYTTTSGSSSDGGKTDDGHSGGNSGFPPSNAITLSPSELQTGVLSSGSSEVWYRVNVNSGYYLWGKSESSVGFYIYDSFGDYVNAISVDASGGEYLFQSSGTYYINVFSSSNYAEYDIGLSYYY